MKAFTNEEFTVAQALKENLETCILGKSEEIDLLLTVLLAEGHVLLEDVPGTGKTVLIKSLAKSIDGQFHRIQCNPDLLPTDITGVSIYHPKDDSFIFRPGPVITNILLIDEINRATTKTQAALLEAMEEKSVTVDGISHELPKPFMMLATQNPIDFAGTYLLPEAQLDRFMMKFSLGYPDESTELTMVNAYSQNNPMVNLKSVTNMDMILTIQEKVKQVHIDQAVTQYAITIVRETRQHKSILLGASPRATLALIHAAKAFAFIKQRDYVIPDDIKQLAPYVLNHRLILQSDVRMEGNTADSVLQSIMEQVTVPVRLRVE
ncbi:AAA family ATPase [Chengkuizengella axinellae]|uniref:MoxR family ATPase n=1 Tax=Chengkuizengella axinellae TaxID=3064388 RepID=A0ABT9IUI8_9BACL|nr:MoxR family ATPase [Chengkuizengella sp. 2205SS18-9]MDP5273025.1 MoxR family ATPase [Chengkuizengella sp. 2205SS18-9]